ncbi:MAG: helix-turn-helix domain-containing protein [Firmicutes bacterium]|nr:helix-turn-helix domain-containing protein [Bacillota bacterium]
MLNERIKSLRKANGLTQVELANKINVSKQCVSNWENNNIQPSIDMLVKLADFFSVSTDYLLCLDERRILDVTGLTDIQIEHIRRVIDDIRE